MKRSRAALANSALSSDETPKIPPAPLSYSSPAAHSLLAASAEYSRYVIVPRAFSVTISTLAPVTITSVPLAVLCHCASFLGIADCASGLGCASRLGRIVARHPISYSDRVVVVHSGASLDDQVGPGRMAGSHFRVYDAQHVPAMLRRLRGTRSLSAIASNREAEAVLQFVAAGTLPNLAELHLNVRGCSDSLHLLASFPRLTHLDVSRLNSSTIKDFGRLAPLLAGLAVLRLADSLLCSPRILDPATRRMSAPPLRPATWSRPSDLWDELFASCADRVPRAGSRILTTVPALRDLELESMCLDSLGGLEHMAALTRLACLDFFRGADLECVGSANLRTLEIDARRLSSLRGVGRLPALTRLVCRKSRLLVDLAEVAAVPLQTLLLEELDRKEVSLRPMLAMHSLARLDTGRLCNG